MVSRPASFATKLTLYFGGLLIAILSGLILLWYFGFPSVAGARERQLDEAMHLLEQAATYRVTLMGRSIEERRGDVLIIAENKMIAAGLEKNGANINIQDELAHVFTRLQSAYPDTYSGLAIIDPLTRKIVASNTPKHLGSVFGDAGLIDRAALPGVTELIDEVSGGERETLAIVRQIHTDTPGHAGERRLVGIVVATLNLTSLLGRSDLYGSFTASLRDRTLIFGVMGRLIAEMPPGGGQNSVFARDSRGANGFEGSLTVAGSDGREFLTVYRHLPLSGDVGWTIVEYFEKDAVLAKLNAQTLSMILLGFLFTLPGLLVVWFIARQSTRPVRKLATVARQLGAGELSIRASAEKNSAREVKDLSTAFNEMAARIEDAHQDLEARVTVRTQLLTKERDSAQRYLDIARVMLIALDRHGRITMINRRGAELLGLPENKILGLDWFGNFLLKGDQESVRQIFAAVMRGEMVGAAQFENCIVNADGKELLMAWNNATLLDDSGVPMGTLSSGEDITERQRAADAMQTMYAELEDRVAERTRELAQSNASLRTTLEYLQRAQKDLIQKEKMASLGALVAGVAHELNTPLGNSVTINSTLIDDLEVFALEVDSNTLTKRHLLEYIEHTRQGLSLLTRGLERANVLVGNFKRVATDQSSEARRRFDLAHTVMEVTDTIAPQFKHTPHRMRMDIPTGILLDSYPGPLGQVVTNLALNALIHGFSDEASGEVRFSVESVTADSVTLCVADNGRGIPPEHLPRIFDPFFTTRLGQGGSGLGLNIVFNLVRGILGGDITVESAPGQGTVFRISLPLVPPSRE